MKTTDLIPLILYELGEGDKYGFELSKSIETLSNGKIVIKQATLYTILKKLEKSKFISSYWQDSEIGGKRHYYKLTQNGNLQLSTMPKVEVIIERILQNSLEYEADGDELSPAQPQQASKPAEFFAPAEQVEQEQENATIEEIDTTTLKFEQESEQVSTQPSLEEAPEQAVQIQLKESVLPSEEVFKDESIDNLTETEINSSNASLLHENTSLKEETFATNKNVTKFTESQPYTPLDLSDKLKPQAETIEQREQIVPKQIQNEEIKFVDYVNFKQTARYINANRLAKNMWYRIFCSSAYLAIVLVACAIIASRFGSSTIGNITLALGICLIVFTPTIYAYKYDKFKTKCQEGRFKFSLKKRIIIAVCLFVIVLVGLVLINIAIGNNAAAKLFGTSNFSNLYAPALASSVILADLLFACLFLKKSKK